jgi:Kelch motif/Galactose oxidase, central domain
MNTRKGFVQKFSLPMQCRTVAAAGVLLACFICSVVAVRSVHSQTAIGTWTMKSPLPAVRAEVAAVALDGRLHALGGSFGGKTGSYHDEYDPMTDQWHPEAPLLAPRDHLAVAVANGKIYAFGGFATDVHTNASNAASEYDRATNVWRSLPSRKVPRGAAGAARVGNKIHVIGGRGLDGFVLATHEVFDPQSSSWTEAAPLPAARDHMVAADGKLHVIGGRFKGPADRTGEHDVYDPATDKWTSAAPLPTPRSGLASAYYHGSILVLGGELPPDYTFPENEAYDPKTNQWTTLSPMPHGRHGFGGDVIGENAYVVGGSLTPGDAGATDQLLIFHLP